MIVISFKELFFIIIPTLILLGPLLWTTTLYTKHTHIHTHTHTHTYIYIYIWTCVWLGSSRSFKYVSLNNKEKFCLHNFFMILSSFLIIVLISCWNWRWISQNCPVRFRTLRRPSSRVGCLCKVCLYLFLKSYIYVNTNTHTRTHARTHTHTHTHTHT